MASPKKKGQSTTVTALEVGAGVLAAAAAGAGYYFYGDKNAKKHRTAASKWVKDMKADVIKEAKKVKKFDQKVMAAIVDKAQAAYSTVRSIDKKDLTAAARELKKHWKEVALEVEAAGARAKKAVTKAVTKAPKKTAPAPKKVAKKSVKKAAKRSS